MPLSATQQILICVGIVLQSTIQTANAFDLEMCNNHGSKPSFDALTMTDLQRIDKLEQLHIIARHGTRTGGYSIKDIFPNMNTSLPDTTWQCNFTFMESRYYDDEFFITLQKNYIEGEEYIGGNCVGSQSISNIREQHKANADAISAYYIGDSKHHLMSRDEFAELIGDTFVRKKYANNNTPYLKIISSDLERTYATVACFMTYFLKQNLPSDLLQGGALMNDVTNYLYTYSHDYMSDPYTPQFVTRCPNIGVYIDVYGKQSDRFQEFIHSDFVSDLAEQWQRETGYEFGVDHVMFKKCENILWMFCGGINLVPGIISEDLLTKLARYTMEYRSAILDNGEHSTKTTGLASMPFAWILKTLIADHVHYLEGEQQQINGYLEAEKARLVFHSTRGISTLYFLSALGISHGLEPVYANMVNIEIYSAKKKEKAMSGDYDGYLFRFLMMGKVLQYPGCEEEYNGGESTLCSLSVLMRNLTELGMPLREWEHHCAEVTDEFMDTFNKSDEVVMGMAVHVDGVNGQMHGGEDQRMSGFGGVLIGIVIGVMLMYLFDRRYYFNNKAILKYETIH